MTDTLSTATRDRPPTARRGGWFGALMLRLHFYAGLFIGPFIFVAAVSGALYALTPQIERVVYQHELTAPVTDDRLTLAEQITIAQDEIGDAGTLSAVRPAPNPGDTTRIMFAQDGLGASESTAVFVDPGTGEIRGQLTAYGTSGALPIRTWVSDLHRTLNLGEPGRLYSELAASWLGIVALAGLALWIIRVRKARKRKDFVRPGRGYTGYRRAFTWHASLGVWVLVGALFLSATGITWSQFAGGNVDRIQSAFDWSTPSVNTVLGDAPAPTGGEHSHHGALSAPTGAANPATFDAVLAIAERVNVNTGLVEIRPPAEPGMAWVVQEIQRSFPTEVDAVAIDGSSLEVVDRTDFADFPLAAKLTRWGIDTHMGSMFGVVNQIVLFLVASGIAAMVVLGYVMWWKRRPGRGFGGKPPTRGVLRDAPWWGVAAVLAGAVFVGWWLPLVGWTLAAFVVVDVALGLASRRRWTRRRVTRGR